MDNNASITLPAGSRQIVLLSSDAITQAMQVVDLVDVHAIVLPIISVLCFVGAIVVAPDRMLGLLRIGASIALAIVILLVAIAIGHELLRNNISAQSREAVDAIVRILLEDFTRAIRATAAIGMVLVIRVMALRYLAARKTTISEFIRHYRAAIVLVVVGAALTSMVLLSFPPAWLSMFLQAIVASGLGILWAWRNRQSEPA